MIIKIDPKMKVHSRDGTVVWYYVALDIHECINFDYKATWGEATCIADAWEKINKFLASFNYLN